MYTKAQKFLASIAALFIMSGFTAVLAWTQPEVVVEKSSNMVISVNGKDVYRPLMEGDVRDAKIIYVD